MAIKDQCNNCKLFDGNICRAHNTLPNYNQTSCEGYSKKGINLDKKEDSSIMSDSAFHQPKGNNSNTNSTTLIPQEFGMFSHPFSFKGRIRRLEFGISLIIFTIWAIIVNCNSQDLF